MDKAVILVIDDEKNIREALRMGLKMESFDVITAEDGADGLEKLTTLGADAVILDLRMPRLGGLDFLQRIQGQFEGMPVIVLTGHGGVDDAVESMKRGAYDFMTKPVNIDKLVLILRRALEEQKRRARQDQLEEMVDARYQFDNIIGNSPALGRVLDMVKQVAPTDATVLITGQSGTGKEVIATAIHRNSPRKQGPFIKVHCAALPDTLLESELFGHEKGAFTGAVARKRGRFELADGGTILLDEIGEISGVTQVKLLRVLQEREFERLGGEETIRVNLRVLAATNKDLKAEVAAGRFREDLYYRLNVVHIPLPGLAERREDIPLLIQHFLQDFNRKHSRSLKSLSRQASALLENYSWPGNIRELQNVIENLVVFSQGEMIEADSLPAAIREYQGESRLQLDVGQTLADIEKQAILATLSSVNGNKSKAARVLSIGRKTLLRKLEEYGLGSQAEEEDTE